MKTIVITGANRGIGFEIAKQLSALGHRVIFTARDVKKGMKAIESLQGDVRFFQLDIEQPSSIEFFVSNLAQSVDHIDVLINNAAIMTDSGCNVRTIDEALFSRIWEINFMGAFRLTRALMPLLDQSKNPRIINMSSEMGQLSNMGFGHPAYRISKTSLNALTAVLASEEPQIKVNAVCPGWVKTKMGGRGAQRPVRKGAETPVWLATAEQVPTGKFLRDQKEIPW